MWLLLFVLLSGLLGAALQHILPRVMLDQVPSETIYDQIDHVLEMYRQEAKQLVQATCGSGEDTGLTAQAGADAATFLVTETVRQVGSIQGRVVETARPLTSVPGSEPLRNFYDRYVEPYLHAASGRTLPLGLPGRAAAHFHELRSRLRPEVHPVVRRLEELCARRRQFDTQRRLHRWLHIWMAFHLLFSAALLVLMLAHAFLALKYV
jgi:hypothetical protein